MAYDDNCILVMQWFINRKLNFKCDVSASFPELVFYLHLKPFILRRVLRNLIHMHLLSYCGKRYNLTYAATTSVIYLTAFGTGKK